MEISVRTATLEDARSIATVEVLSWQSAYRGLMPDAFLKALSIEEKTEDWTRNLLKDQQGSRKRAIVGVGNGEILGFARIGPLSHESEVGLLYLLYVLPEYWRCGVGRVLMGAAVDELRELGHREAILWVLQDNYRARNFYETLGWHTDGRTRTDDYGGVQLDAVYYCRVLAI